MQVMKKNILPIILSLAVLSATANVYADGTKNDKEKKPGKENSEKIVDKLKNVLDNELQLENWMTNANGFEMKENFYEEDLTLESWMTEAESFNKEMLPLDPGMELERWMTKTFEFEKMEVAMNLEEWMLKPFPSPEQFTEEELVLEDWMLKF